MDQTRSGPAAAAEPPDFGTPRPSAPTRKRSISGGLLSKLPFVRSSGDSTRPRSRRSTEDSEVVASAPNGLPVPSFRTIPATDPTAPPPLSHAILQHQAQQQKTRRRRGSLRKVALLGRGAQRERREDRGLTIDTRFLADGQQGKPAIPTDDSTPFDAAASGGIHISPGIQDGSEAFGLGISDVTPRPSMDGYASRSATNATPTEASAPRPRQPPLTTPTATMRSPQDLTTTDSTLTSPSISYSTTDDEDGLHMAGPPSRPTTPSLSLSSSSISLLRPERASLSSGSESYFPNGHAHPRPLGLSTASSPSIQNRRSTIQRAKSPLALTSLAGLSTTPLPAPEGDWDYAETEWWGWVVLIVTWTVFVVGMGSCLGVWSWAWDVGTTPYAPPELEDDPTLPIVGYYPALMILTSVMAWVWVVAAWVGMKYFRHARVSGD
ncbi:hypothetical protein QBC47DRAFT_384782 [Echria macrotheca]|uniref:Uncharacterized protein n=1 Tax=Echria macrotheca TaxID=438768 RepID=A0AAJ0F8V0_9PEZI|nr:hypothetical protein QBC47DRAFT_384782 [Echria macrotheca]